MRLIKFFESISLYEEDHPDYEAQGPFHDHELPGEYDAPAFRYTRDAFKQNTGGDGGFSLLLRGENIVEINQISSDRKGGGTAMMDMLTKLADKMGIILTLRPEPYDVGGDRSMPLQKLRAWYTKYGFEDTGHHNQMARRPTPMTQTELFPETNGQNVTGNKLTESMNFYPAVETKPKQWGSVFPREWTDELDRENVDWEKYHGDYDHEYEPPTNPEFRPDLDLNLSNGNMVYIFRDVLGYQMDPDDHGFHIPIDHFLTKAQMWLQKQVGQTTPEVPTQEEPREFKRQVTTDPETGVPAISGGYQGARMINVGRREGYDNETVMRMVKIANLGKEMGATHVSAF